MVKATILLLSTWGFFTGNLFAAPIVNVSQLVPSSVAVNTSFIVQVAINKGDGKGAGKFTEQLPAGFSAFALELQGSTASIENNVILFSWDSLPPDGIINISFRVDVNANAHIGNDTLIGKFNYIAGNQNLEADAMPSYISITSSSPGNISDTHISSAVDIVKTVSANVFVKRNISLSSLPPNSYAKVTLTIHKSNLRGFGKIEETLPQGFTAAASIDDMKGVYFTFVDNIAKFVWQSLSSDSLITVSYLLKGGLAVSGTVAISGTFSYLNNDIPASCPIDTTLFTANPTAANNTSTPPPIIAPPIVTPPDATNVPNNTITAPPPAPIAVPETVVYKIQLFATPDNLTETIAFDGITDKTSAESENGMYRYLSGNFTNLNDAISYINHLKSIGYLSIREYKNGAYVPINQPENEPISPSLAVKTNATPTPAAASYAPSATATKAGLIFKVQLGAFGVAPDQKFIGMLNQIKDVSTDKDNAGRTHYFAGSFNNIHDATSTRDQIRQAGIKDAYLISLYNGHYIPMSEAVNILKK